jgi:hypothetical protein
VFCSERSRKKGGDYKQKRKIPKLLVAFIYYFEVCFPAKVCIFEISSKKLLAFSSKILRTVLKMNE